MVSRLVLLFIENCKCPYKWASESLNLPEIPGRSCRSP
jgi:hypothetical protein